VCDFRKKMRHRWLKSPEIGYKLAYGDYTGTVGLSKRSDGWMKAEDPWKSTWKTQFKLWEFFSAISSLFTPSDRPRKCNEMGWYIFAHRPPSPVSASASLWEVEFKGHCIFGWRSLDPLRDPGVRAEYVRFIRKLD